jgi:hypothetical protein
MERFSTIDVLANDADHYYRMQVAVTAAPAVRAKHASAVPLFRCSAQLQQQPCTGIPGLRPPGRRPGRREGNATHIPLMG